MKTSCNHDYCDECLLKWYIFKNKSCPYCRDEIVMNESIIFIN